MPNLLTRGILGLQRFITSLPFARRIASRHPRFARAVSGRFDTSAFSGLTLTILLVVFIIATSLLADIAEDVSNSESIVKMDLSFSTFLFQHRSPILSQIMYVITQFASRYAAIGLGVLFSAIMLYRKKKIYIIAFWAIVLGMGLSIHFAKIVFHRARPIDIAYYIEDNFSFPSGHSATAMVLYGFIAFTLVRLARGASRAIGLGLCCLFIPLVGFSRIYLGVHFMSDVLGGFLLGFIWVILGISLVEWQESRKRIILRDNGTSDSKT